MTRPVYSFAPSALLFALLSACGGASDPGLFSSAGASGSPSGAAGASNAAGNTASAGADDTPPSEGGSAAVAGAGSTAGQSAGGVGNTGGSSAGAESGGSVNQAGSAGSSAGNSSGGSAGSSAGSAGSGTAGSSGNAGMSGTAGMGGTAGAGGSEPTCKELLAQASTQLEAARACKVNANARQCTGTVKTTCDCDVPVEDANSDETQAYEATLKQINAKKCRIACSAIACLPVNHAQCRATSFASEAGSCVAFGATPQ